MKNLAVLFGGRSAEHEISIITALQMIKAIDPFRYRVVPVYIHPTGKWYTGEALLDKAFYKGMPDTLNKVQRVTLLPEPTTQGLLKVTSEGEIAIQGMLPVDVYFLAFHGQGGEDGSIQGLLEMADVPYTGCGVAASALAMDKYQCKMFLQAHGIPVLPAKVIFRKQANQHFVQVVEDVLSTPGLENFPLFVKPCHLGSSIGIARASNLRELAAALAGVFRYDDEALVEPCIMQLMEINVAVIDGNPPRASVVEVPVASDHSLTYEDKYLRGKKKSSSPYQQGMAGLTRVIDPQDMPESLKKTATDLALKAFQLIGCSGVGRFDFIFDKATHQLYFNELNPIPGSFSFYLWEKSHPPLYYTSLVDEMVEQATQRKKEQLALQRDIGFKALLT